MESQIKTVVCPNCGANATNLQNCEYCNSILVRCYAAQANGVNFEIEELKATLNSCDPDRRIEHALQKIYDMCPGRNDGFIDIYYKNSSESFTQLLCGYEGFSLNICITLDAKYNNIEKKVYTLTKKLGFEFDDGEGVLDFGLDIRTLAQVIYLMCNSYYEDFQTENITYGLIDILPDDIILDSDGEELKQSVQQNSDEEELKQSVKQNFNGEELKQSVKQNSDKSSNSGRLGVIVAVIVIAAVIGMSVTSLFALLLMLL